MSNHQDDILQLESYNNVTPDELKAELIRLTHQLNEEKSNSKQAAEYGLSLLEDFKKSQSKNYELEGEIETIKSELESTNIVSKLYNIFVELMAMPLISFLSMKSIFTLVYDNIPKYSHLYVFIGSDTF